MNIEPLDLYNLIFDIGKSDRESIADVPSYLIDQLLNASTIPLYYDANTKLLWRLDAWKRSPLYYWKTKEESKEDTRKWNLMKEAAKLVRKKLINMDYEECFTLVQLEVQKKRWVILKACGVDVEGEEWKGLVTLPDGNMKGE